MGPSEEPVGVLGDPKAGKKKKIEKFSKDWKEMGAEGVPFLGKVALMFWMGNSQRKGFVLGFSKKILTCLLVGAPLMKTGRRSWRM